MPGVGKTSIGVVVAKIVGLNFIDSDLLIQTNYHTALNRLILEKGNHSFLTIENEILQTIDTSNTLIATGGSAVYAKEGMSHLKDIAIVIYLKAKLNDLQSRLGSLQNRGVVTLSTQPLSIEQIYQERQSLYEKYCDFVFDVDSKDVSSVAIELARLIQNALKK